MFKATTMYIQSITPKIAAGLLSLSLLAGGTIIQPQRVQAAAVQVADPEVIYIVQRGDTLYSIAKRYGTTVQAVMSYNSLGSTTIYVGQRLLIPVATSPQSPSEPILYVVQPDDTLSGIARRYNSTVSAIKQSNGLSGDTIYVGQRLLVPIGTNVPNPPTPPPPSSSTAERIQFRSGATSDTRGGYTSAIAPKRYVLRAAAGQQMTVALKTTSAFVHLVIVAPNSGLLVTSDRALQSWTGELPLDGDYTVEVRNNGQGNADFGITVTILGRTSSSVPCLATSPVRRTYVDPDKQYCLLYPSAFQLKDAAIGRIGIYGPPLDQTSEPVFAAVMIYNEGPANGTSLEEVVNIYVQNHAEGAVAARQPTTLGGEAAIRVAGLPGRTGSRHIFVVHAGMVYHLSFYPVDPAFPQVATDMQTLWQTVMESFSFMR